MLGPGLRRPQPRPHPQLAKPQGVGRRLVPGLAPRSGVKVHSPVPCLPAPCTPLCLQSTSYLVRALRTRFLIVCLPCVSLLDSELCLICLSISLLSNQPLYLQLPARSTGPSINMLVRLIDLMITVLLMGSVRLTFPRTQAPRLTSGHTPSKRSTSRRTQGRVQRGLWKPAPALG